MLLRSDMGHISVQVAGVTLDSVSWDSFEGGELTVDGQMFNPGGMVPAVAAGGKRTRGQGTLKRAWSDVLYAAYVALESVAGFAAVTIGYQPMAGDRKTLVGTPLTFTGTLGTVTRPAYDSMTSTVSMLQIVCDLNE